MISSRFFAAFSLFFSVPAALLAQEACPLLIGEVPGELVSSQRVFDIISGIPPEKDEFQTTEQYDSQVFEELGPLTEAGIVVQTDGDSSFISYNADYQRIEVGVGFFDFGSSLVFSAHDLESYFNLSITDLNTYFGEHLIIGLADVSQRVGQFTGQNSFGVSREVDVLEQTTISVHGGIVKKHKFDTRVVDGEVQMSSAHYSFVPDEVVESDTGYVRPVYTIPMASEDARIELPTLRGVVALSGLSSNFLVTTGYKGATIDNPKEVHSKHFLFPSDIVCAGFIGADGRVLKVMDKLEQPYIYWHKL